VEPFRDIWDNDNRPNLWAIRGSEKDEKEGGADQVLNEAKAKKLLSVGNPQFQEAERIPNRINPRKST
jgi:hypothetical protein